MGARMRECESAGFNLRQKCETRASSRDGKKKRTSKQQKELAQKYVLNIFLRFAFSAILFHSFPLSLQHFVVVLFL